MHAICRIFQVLVFAVLTVSCGASQLQPADLAAAVDAGIRQACEGLARMVAAQNPGVDAERIIETACHAEHVSRKLRDILLQNQLNLARAAGVMLPELQLAPPPPELGHRPPDEKPPE
jgi:hypothetical protein